MPPVLYFYCKALFDQSFVFRRSNLLHFSPALIYLLYSLILFVGDKIILDAVYFYADGKDKDFSFWYQVLGLISMILYLIKSLQLYKRYKSITFETVSFADTLTFKWARRFLIAFIMLIMLRVAFFIVNPEWAQFGRKFWYYLSFSVLFYYISISGFANSIRSVVSFEGLPNRLPFKSDTDLDYSVEYEISEKEAQNAKEVEMAIPDLEVWKERVERLMMEDKIYENPELSIYDLSQELDTHPKKVSQVINLGFDMNFNDYVNQKRVQAVIEKLEAGEHTIHTLLGIAFECGFNSKSTFNRAFKRHTSLSPQEYIKKNVQ
ncbi:helix-turn-helix domain-containing protein [Aquiflexum sp.]|uniref:helix-turn-helix domain-containing protein n=1 Tax=Aquiflexum sp. TaxID=1872584 RepID=UPI0035944812